MYKGTNGQLRVLLFIEGDVSRANTLKTGLEKKGCAVDSFTSYSNIVKWIVTYRYKQPYAIIIDVPELDLGERPGAFKLYQWIREGGTLASQVERFRGWNTPILMLVTDQNFDTISTELINYHEILPNSFLPRSVSEELIYAQLLGLQGDRSTSLDGMDEEPDIIAIDNLMVAREYRQVMVDSIPIKLGPLEYDFLEYFILHRHKEFVKHEEILENVWGIPKSEQKQKHRQYVTVYKQNITKKFKDTGYPNPLESAWSEGYSFRFTNKEQPDNKKSDPNGTNPTFTGENPTHFATGYLFFDTDQPSKDGENDYDYLKDISGVLPLGNPGVEGVKLGRGYQPGEKGYGTIDLIIDDNRLNRVSRNHATILLRNDGHYYIHDNNSAGYTYIIRKGDKKNEKRRVYPGAENEQRLQHGDRVCFNVVEYRFEVR